MARPYTLSLPRAARMADRHRAALLLAEDRMRLSLERQARLDAGRAMGLGKRQLAELARFQ